MPSDMSRTAQRGGRADRKKTYLKTKMCKFHILGICAKGENCTYAHERVEMKNIPDLSFTKMCQAQLTTGCSDINCRYAHHKEQLRTPECEPGVFENKYPDCTSQISANSDLGAASFGDRMPRQANFIRPGAEGVWNQAAEQTNVLHQLSVASGAHEIMQRALGLYRRSNEFSCQEDERVALRRRADDLSRSAYCLLEQAYANSPVPQLPEQFQAVYPENPVPQQKEQGLLGNAMPSAVDAKLPSVLEEVTPQEEQGFARDAMSVAPIEKLPNLLYVYDAATGCVSQKGKLSRADVDKPKLCSEPFSEFLGPAPEDYPCERCASGISDTEELSRLPHVPQDKPLTIKVKNTFIEVENDHSLGERKFEGMRSVRTVGGYPLYLLGETKGDGDVTW
jgi:hypothetical protein